MKRCYVIASGPSIKQMDLNLLKDEITICVNESFKAIDFDPTYIAIGDRELYPRIKEKYASMKNTKVVCSSGLNGKVGQDYPGDNLIQIIPLNKKKDVIKDGFRFDLKEVHKAWNVIPEIVLPWVCAQGFDECYLLGCDCTNNGYFYNDPARGEGWQKVEDKTMIVYDIISKLKLPAKIYNSTIGGKLESFERKALPELHKKSLLVVGYYTPDADYEDLANNMKQTVEKQGLECAIYPRNSLSNEKLAKPMGWVLNCSQCADFIYEMQKEFPTRPLLYLDADAEMIKYPELIDKLINSEYDFAAPFLTNKYVENELQSNTLFFNSTGNAKYLARLWQEEQTKRNKLMLTGNYRKPYKEAWDQKVLHDVLKNSNINYKRLPNEYAKITLTPKGENLMPDVEEKNIVIRQTQASRRNKKKV